MNLPLFKIYWDEKDIDYVNKKIISGQYWCTGEENEILENKICEYLDMPYVGYVSGNLQRIPKACKIK